MEKFTNTVRGGVNPFKINGLVADAISDELATRLLDKTFIKRGDDIFLYISNVGNDATADGTKTKPFKTLKACVNHAVYNIGSNSNILIRFLSDYNNTETVSVVSHGFKYIGIDGETFNVTLGPVYATQCYMALSNVTIKQTSIDMHCIYSGENAFVRLENNISIEMLHNATRQGLHANFGKISIMPSVNLKFIGAGAPNVFMQANMCGIVWCNANSVTVDSRMTEGTFIICNGLSYVEFIPTTFTAPPRPNGRAYSITRNSHISFFGKGKPNNMGGQENIDSSSSIS